MEVSEISSNPVWAVLLLLELLFWNVGLKIKTFATFEGKKQNIHLPKTFSLKFPFFCGGKGKK